VRVVLRLLGVELLSRLAQRLPGRLAWWASLLVLVVVNLLPVVAVLRGDAGIGDVFLVYWIENVVVWATGIVRIATAEGTGGPRVTSSGSMQLGNAAFFALHYGIFTFVHGVFTLFIVILTGLKGGLVPVLVLAAAISAGHLVQLGVVWFGRGERRLVSPGSAMVAPYPRMFAMHGAVIAGFFLVLQPNGEQNSVKAVAVLCVAKTVIDLAFHLLERVVNTMAPAR
jgi:hypothetical protein